MNLLFTNDDGILSPGIQALLKEFAAEHQVVVAAPDRQRSAASGSMSIRMPLTVTRHVFEAYPQVTAYAVSGTPVDCARLGFGCLAPETEAVVSGINLGPNRGTDVIYSGTCGAAQEAAVHGLPALALSLDGRHDRPFVHFDTAAKVGRWGLDLLRRRPLPFGGYYSINVPDLPLADLKGIRWAPLGLVLYEAAYLPAVNEAGEQVYVECGERILNGDEFRDTDEYWLSRGYATVTPLGFDCGLPLPDQREEPITAIER